MNESVIKHIKEIGVVGAGGAGFPAYVKLSTRAQIVLVNAAECEPLLHKDKELLHNRSQLFFKGLQIVMEQVGAEKGIIGIKEKHHVLIDYFKQQLPDKVELVAVRDFYPAGDEITLIHETTGRVVEAGSLPGSQGIVVHNVETICNIGGGQPVVTKFLNLTGEVNNPVTVEVPLGISFRELIDFAGPKLEKYAVIEGGPMMGKLVDNYDQPVTKTTAALILLPEDHVLVEKFTTLADQKRVDKIGKAACDQCMLCTDLCPRFLLGHPIQPHLAMRSLLFSREEKLPDLHTLYCCECNLCSFISCPEGLSPSMVCIDSKKRARAQQLKYAGKLDGAVHPMRAYRQTPTKKLKAMLDLNRYEDTGPLVDFTYQPKVLQIALQQHIGKTAEALVRTGDMVIAGQKVASVGQELGSEIHSPCNGQVTGIDDRYIVVSVDCISGMFEE